MHHIPHIHIYFSTIYLAGVAYDLSLMATCMLTQISRFIEYPANSFKRTALDVVYEPKYQYVYVPSWLGMTLHINIIGIHKMIPVYTHGMIVRDRGTHTHWLFGSKCPRVEMNSTLIQHSVQKFHYLYAKLQET